VTFANPAGLWLTALVVPIVLLHILRPRRQPQEVSSTFLWRSVAQPVSAASPWQRLRPSVLLILQLLAVLLLAAIVANPVRATAAPLAEHTVFIIDASGSMAAKDGQPDRLADAKAAARRLRRQLPAGGVASIVVASDRPRVVLTTSADGGAFADALRPIQTTAGTADWSTAFLLAESLETPAADIGFEIVSDGDLTDAEQRLLPPGSHYTAIGDRSTNRAITRLSVEPRGSGLHARVTLANTGGAGATTTLRLDVDGRTVSEQSLRLEEREVTDVDIDLPAGDQVEAFLEGDDLLDADDHAFAVTARRRALKVLVAGPSDTFLDTLLASLPGVTVDHVDDGEPAVGYDVAVYNRVDPPADPGAPFFAIAPPGGVPAGGVTVTGAVDNPAVALVLATDPLVEDLDLSEVVIVTAQRVEAPTATVVVGAEDAPLLLRGTLAGRPFTYLSFELGQSTLPVQIAFPILGDRLLTDLAGAALPPGDLVVGQPLPVEPGTNTTVVAPGGARTEVVPGGPAPTATRPGFWTISTEGQPDRTVAVNASPRESSLQPAPSLLTPERQQQPGEHRPRGERSLRSWVAWPLLAVLALELFFARRKLGVTRRQWRAAVALRAVIALLLIGSLLNLAIVRRADRVATVFLIDASDSIGSAGKAEAVRWVQDALDHQPRGALAGVALFGGDARLELTVQHAAALGRPAVKIDSSRTNLAGAMRLAAAVLPADARRRIVLVSDGRATVGDAAAEAARLRDEGIEVDTHLVGRSGGADVAVASVDAPSLVHEGEAFSVTATIASSVAGPVQLTLLRDGEVVDQRVVKVDAGQTTIEIPQIGAAAGLSRYQLRVAAAGDSITENDVGYTAVQVEGPPTVLVLEGAAGEAGGLADALRAGGMTVDVRPATSLPPIDELATFTATVLVDVDARSLTEDQVRTLAAATRDLGHGLVTVGGDHSYGLGGYLASPLEELLPVISEITDPKRRQSVAEVLAIDTSGSMGACHCSEGNNQNRLSGGVQKDDIAKAAAARTIEALAADDEIGVLAFNTEHRWLIDLQKLPSEEVVQDGLRSITPQGGTDLTLSLRTAAEELRGSHAALKHIILFTDGFTSQAALSGLAEEAADLYAEGITVSVLATGEGAADALEEIATAGHGRFYPGRDLQLIPQIMVEEAVLASRDFITEGEFFPEVTSSDDPVRELTSSPPLLGYIATTTKPAASTLLRIGPDHDPLLARWQAGLGTVTSWTSDASARWSQQWAGWDGYVSFWTAVVKDTFATSAGGGVRARVENGVLKITVESETSFPDGAAAVARVTAPDLSSQEVRLERTAGNTFAGELPVTQAGTYAVGATVSASGTGAGSSATVLSASTLASQSYAAEYQPGEPDAAALARVAATTGGRNEIRPAQAFDASDLAAGRSRIALAGWLLFAAALLWPVAVALSRLALRGAGFTAVRERAAWAGWVARWVRSRVPSRPGAEPRARPERPPRPAPKPPPEPVAPPPTLGRLLEKKRETRTGAPPE